MYFLTVAVLHAITKAIFLTQVKYLFKQGILLTIALYELVFDFYCSWFYLLPSTMEEF